MWNAARVKVLAIQERRKAEKNSQQIDLQIRNDRKHPKREPEVLLFGKFIIDYLRVFDQNDIGGPESGTSTFLQQLKIIYNGGFSKEEAELFKRPSQLGLLQSLILILQRMKTDRCLKLKHLCSSSRKYLSYSFRNVNLTSRSNWRLARKSIDNF